MIRMIIQTFTTAISLGLISVDLIEALPHGRGGGSSGVAGGVVGSVGQAAGGSGGGVVGK